MVSHQKVIGPILYKIRLASLYISWKDTENSLNEPLAKVCHPVPKAVLQAIYKKVFLSKFPILSTGLLRQWLSIKITARWRYRLSLKNLTPHYDSKFCVSFNFCIDQESQRRL